MKDMIEEGRIRQKGEKWREKTIKLVLSFRVTMQNNMLIDV